MKKLLSLVLALIICTSAVLLASCSKDDKEAEPLKDGATILIPTDGSNQTRALLLLQQEGLIKLKDGVKATDDVNVNDITENKHNYKIVPVSAETLTSQLSNADDGTIAVINGNYAISAGLKIKDALATESVSGDAAQTYANIVAVKSGNENLQKIKALVNALRSTKVKEYIANQYNGAVVATFADSELDLEIPQAAGSDTTIKVGASSAPHAEILEQVKDVLKDKGYTLEITIYDDYVLPNTAVENGDIDANYFQHTPYLDWFNGEQSTHIVSVAKVHYEPFGIYGKNVSGLK